MNKESRERKIKYQTQELEWLRGMSIEYQRYFKYLQACYLLHQLPVVREKGEELKGLVIIARCLLDREYDLNEINSQGAGVVETFFLSNAYNDPKIAEKIIKNYETYKGFEE